MLACNFFFLFQTFDTINHFFSKSYRNPHWYGTELKEYTRLTVGEKLSILILQYKLLLKFDVKQKPRIEFLASDISFLFTFLYFKIMNDNFRWCGVGRNITPFNFDIQAEMYLWLFINFT